MKEIHGYKAFNGDMTNRYGMQFEEGKTYSVPGSASFGLKGNGFHLCKNIEDTFRYVNPDDCTIAEVTGFGDIAYGYDDYYEYYDMYATTSITIDKVLSREEVINKVLAKSNLSIYRFISTGFTLTEEEVKIFQEKCKDDKTIQAYIDYYVNKNEDAFSLKKKM